MNTRGTGRTGALLVGALTLMLTLGGCVRTIAPTVNSTDPSNGATGVAVNRSVSAVFSVPMDPATINATTFTLKRGTTPVAGSVTYAGVTATFNPTSDLLPNTLYTATISMGAQARGDSAKSDLNEDLRSEEEQEGEIGPDRDDDLDLYVNPHPDRDDHRHRHGFFLTLLLGTFLAGQGGQTVVDGPLDADFVWSFTTGAGSDTVAPRVIATLPTDDATNISLGSNLSITFSESMNAATINATTITLSRGAISIPGTVSYSGVTATFNPTALLAPDTEYTATVTTGARDQAGNALASNFTWRFTTGEVVDTIAPTVVSTFPSNGALGVQSDANISATFSEAMNPATINALTFTVSRGTTPILGTVTYTGLTATFNPTALLAADTEYTATISTGARDQAGNALASNFTWRFTTEDAGDTTAPTIISTFPDNGALGVLTDENVSATFSEEMNPLTITSTTFTLSRGAVLVPATVTYSGTTALLNPTSELSPNTVYIARVTTGAEDLAGNALESEFLWVYTTGDADDTTAPTVSSTTPTNGETFVAIDANVTVTFSEPMDRLSINNSTFQLEQGGNPVAGTVSYSGVTATFNPVAPLQTASIYIGRITTGANDPSGNPLLVDYTWVFVTGSDPDTSRPRVSATVPVNGAINAPLGGNLSATFTEAMDPVSINANTFILTQGTTRVPGLVSYAGVTATFNPTAALLPSTIYTARITNGARDLSDNTLLVDYVWTFATGSAVDSTRPEVSSTFPDDGAENIGLGGNISATFTEAMNPLTITPLTFTLMRGATSVYGTVSYSGVTATFNPTATLLPNTEYTATITNDVRDLAGNTKLNDYVWSFTTGATPDTTRPTVTSTVPRNAALGVGLGGNLSATFSEPMNPLTINSATFTLERGATEIVGVVTYSGVTATFNPTTALLPNALHTATILMEATDLAGNELLVDYVWVFTTGAVPDTVAPTMVSTFPDDGATGVSLGGNLSATFSEPMNPLTITPLTFTLDRGDTPVLGTVTYSGVTATFNPTTALLPNTEYTATITAGAEDLAGNELADDFVWSFTTGATPDTTRPSVVSTVPDNLAVGVAIGGNLSATFSEAMNPLTINSATFTLDRGLTPVVGTVTYSGVTATFNPNSALAPNTLYTATILMEAEDLSGNELLLDFVWAFTTGAQADTLAPMVVSTVPVDGAIGVPLGGNISATFSEPMNPLTITPLTFTLDQGDTPVLGTVTYSGSRATFNPVTALLTNTVYTATIWMEATDLAGNSLEIDEEWTFSTGLTTAAASIDLGSANAFAILAGSTVSNTGLSFVTGDLGVSPGTAVEGFPPGVLFGAVSTGVGSAAGQAKEDLNIAFDEAAGQSTGSVSLPGNLSGLTLFPGLYTNSTSVMLSVGSATLDAQGDENAVFLFQMGSTLTTGTGTQVILAGGAKAANIYWQVGTAATLGTNSDFKGNILAESAITLATGAVLEGRALTQSAAVTLDAAIITVPAD